MLLIGGMALACLALVVALVFEANDPASTLALDRPTEETAPSPPALSVAGPAASEYRVPDAVFTDEPEPIASGVLTALEQAAQEPIDVELARLLDALQYGFGERSVQVEPTLRPYAFRLAGRLNVRSIAFRVRVAAPDPALAEARAATLRNLFEAAGVAPGRVSFIARRGAPTLLAEPV